MRYLRVPRRSLRMPDMNLHRRRWLGASVGVLVTACAAILLWALFWPVADCDKPSCARHRFTVGLELDAFGQVEPIDFEVAAEQESYSLRSILKDGGIEIVPVADDLDLPFDPSSGPLDSADLFQFVSAWRDHGPIDGADATLYALFVNMLVADNGDELFGIMFDTAGREGFAVAPRTTERFFQSSEPESISTLKLRTFTHELLHALNRHHSDAALFRDGRLTLEAPTRCIAEAEGRKWRLVETPLMALSPDTIRFFQTASARDVLPGRGNSPYMGRRSSATECDEARTHRTDVNERSRWSLAMRRLRNLFGVSLAQAAEDPTEGTSVESASVEIRLQAQEAAYPLGYPIAVRVLVRNTGEEPLPIIDRLSPRYGMLQMEARALGEDEWRAVQPMTWFEPTSDEQTLLAPGALTEETVPVYFGEDGWTFAEPGEYEIRAHLLTDEENGDAFSAPLKISVAAPETQDDREALQPLLDEEGRLADRVGRLLYFGGRIGDSDDIEPLEQATEHYGHTALGSALRLTLVSHRLRKPIDPQTGRRPAPDFDEARELLEDTCSDSGVAAMTSDLLRQRADPLPGSIRDRSETEAVAWDGRSPNGSAIATYSDTTLQKWGPSLHFCFNESEMRGRVRTAATQLGRQLRRDRDARIVLVGHSDSVGTCRYNDSLAFRRARAVEQALIGAGVRRDAIAIASIGERRPRDFSWTPEAQQLNRRVEILVEGHPPPIDMNEIFPRCPDTSRQAERFVPTAAPEGSASP